MGSMSIMGRQGDIKVTWSADNRDEVNLAKEQFDSALKRNMLAFSVKRDGSRGDQIKKFDPDAERIILAPQVAGGVC